MTSSGGSNSPTIHVNQQGERVYPCRCGETHSGQYAAEDFAHHNCAHDATLVCLSDQSALDVGDYDVMCPMCGAMWNVRRG